MRVAINTIRCLHLAVASWIGAVMLVSGCGPPKTAYPAALNSERPDERIAAIRRAGETNDRSVTGILIDRLEDDDEAVRLFAILALERLTGTRLGYDYHAPEAARRRAVERWRRHLIASCPADDAAGGAAP